MFNEWQSQVLRELFDMADRREFEDRCMTIPEVANILEKKKIASVRSLMEFLYELKKNKIFVKNGTTIRNYRTEHGYVFDKKQAYYYIKDVIEDSIVFQLMAERIYNYIIRKTIK